MSGIRIIDRYLLREVTQTFVAVTAVLLIVLLSNQLARVLGQAAQGGFPAEAVVRLIGLTTVQQLPLLVPIGLFLGIVLALGRLYHESEMTAIGACGVGTARIFRPIMTPLLATRWRATGFLALIGLLTLAAAGMGAARMVPLKMLPFDNKNELLLVFDFDEGTTLERAAAAVGEFETLLAAVPEVTDFASYVGVAGPIGRDGHSGEHSRLDSAPCSTS